MEPITAAQVDALLPQTQCARCGYAGCLPYAQAIAERAAPINRCPPGGQALVARLARLTARPVVALDRGCGVEQPLAVAVIDEAACIGCTLCIAACPMDAILGAPKRMHAVMPSLCSGCELCVAPCPVDCIRMESAKREWSADDASAARRRHHARAARLARAERVSRRASGTGTPAGTATTAVASGTGGPTVATAGPIAPAAPDGAATRRAAVAAALERASARRARHAR
jgi:H+/Na+-translocating ferredoxin:NAD+ oxidoreductase subunit B